MELKKRVISYLFLLSFGIVLAHNIIPHHHHFEVNHEPHSCSVQHSVGHHQSHFPPHCHAFNETSFLKNTQTSIQLTVKAIAIPDLFLINTTAFLLSYQQKTNNRQETIIPLPDSFLLSPYARRAPPVETYLFLT